MKTIRYEYVVSLFDGARTVGVHRTADLNQADELMTRWRSQGERHTARWEKKPVLENEYLEPVAAEAYLTQ